MIPEIARFEKVSQAEYNKYDTQYYHPAYDQLELPKISTKGSAGHDFITPVSIALGPGDSTVIPTFMKCEIEPGWVLQIYPRSSLGFKHHVTLANTVGIIDQDYYNNPKNEGHIMVKLVNNGDEDLFIEEGSKFCQGLFVPYGIAKNAMSGQTREGGIGSTGA